MHSLVIHKVCAFAKSLPSHYTCKIFLSCVFSCIAQVAKDILKSHYIYYKSFWYQEEFLEMKKLSNHCWQTSQVDCINFLLGL